jgi:hypothetical protein
MLHVAPRYPSRRAQQPTSSCKRLHQSEQLDSAGLACSPSRDERSPKMSSQNPNFTVYYSSTGQIRASLRYPCHILCCCIGNRRHVSRTRSDRDRKRSPNRPVGGTRLRYPARRYLRFLGRLGCTERSVLELQSCLRFADWPIGRATSRHCRRDSLRRVAVRWYGSPDRNSHGCHDACGAARGSQHHRRFTIS